MWCLLLKVTRDKMPMAKIGMSGPGANHSASHDINTSFEISWVLLPLDVGQFYPSQIQIQIQNKFIVQQNTKYNS